MLDAVCKWRLSFGRRLQMVTQYLVPVYKRRPSWSPRLQKVIEMSMGDELSDKLSDELGDELGDELSDELGNELLGDKLGDLEYDHGHT